MLVFRFVRFRAWDGSGLRVKEALGGLEKKMEATIMGLYRIQGLDSQNCKVWTLGCGFRDCGFWGCHGFWSFGGCA